MRVFYHITVYLMSWLLPVAALFSPKLRLFVRGRKQSFSKLAALKDAPDVCWFHAASLGEFEQGRPLIEALKKQHPQQTVLLTFFSPSGYEVQKDYPLADVVCYLPMDTPKNVNTFLKLVQPKLAVFIKYEFWPNTLRQLQKQAIPTLLVSGIFRKDQLFFSALGGWMRTWLKAFDHFFVQDQNSKDLLSAIGYTNATIAGDTRFDRVGQLLAQKPSLEWMESFKASSTLLVAGSTWTEDEALLIHYINGSIKEGEKVVIAPHHMDEKAIQSLEASIQKEVVRYTKCDGIDLATVQVLILDTIGMLTSVYAYADFAYVGGGLTSNGVHNVLEPATYGVPVVIGPEFKKYAEVVDLVNLKGCQVIRDQESFTFTHQRLFTDLAHRTALGGINQAYVQKHLGATEKIMNYITHKFV